MRDLLVADGVSDAAITLEDQSTNTLENIRNGARLAKSAKIIIVTDRYHARRALMVARHLRLDASADCPAPVPGQWRHRCREAVAMVGYWMRLRVTPTGE